MTRKKPQEQRHDLITEAVTDMRMVASAAASPRVVLSVAALLEAAAYRVKSDQWRRDEIAVNALRAAATWLGEESPA